MKTATTGFTYTGLNIQGLKAEFNYSCSGTCNDITSLGRSLPLQNHDVVYFQLISNFESKAGSDTPQIRLYNGTTNIVVIGAYTGSFMSVCSPDGNSSSSKVIKYNP